MDFNDGSSAGRASGAAAVEAPARILHEKEKTRRLLIGAACFFLCVAALIVIFAQDGKQTMSYIVGVAFLITALGAVGVAQFKVSVPGISVAAAGGGAVAYAPVDPSLKAAADAVRQSS